MKTFTIAVLFECYHNGPELIVNHADVDEDAAKKLAAGLFDILRYSQRSENTLLSLRKCKIKYMFDGIEYQHKRRVVTDSTLMIDDFSEHLLALINEYNAPIQERIDREEQEYQKRQEELERAEYLRLKEKYDVSR